MVLLSDKIAVVFYSEQLLCYTACGGEKMSTDDKFEHLVDEPECMQKIRKQEEKLRKMVEPPAGIKKIMENEARIADMASAATRLSSMNLPSLDVPYMAGAMEMAHAMSQLPKPAIAPHIPQIMKEISDRMDAIVAPARESQALLKGMEAVRKWDLPTFTKPELMGFLEASKYFDVIPHAALDWSSWTTPLSEVSRRLSDCAAAFSFDGLSEVLQKTIYPYFNWERQKRQERIFAQTLSAARWFPYIRGATFFPGFFGINQILAESPDEQERVNQIDQMVFSFYTEERVQEIKAEWGELGLPEHIYRILAQAVDAYLRGEYAMTTIVLSSLWEGIVGQKATGQDSYKVSKRTIQNFQKLIKVNELPGMCAEFYETNVMYTCTSVEEVKPDVPGRHANAHGWFSSYPTQKAGLNAIMLTDFLLFVVESVADAE